MKAINRNCAVCNKKMKIEIKKGGNYSTGQYFGDMKLPVGEGEWKKIGVTDILGKKLDVVKWTGKEKEVEYWECNTCFEDAL